MFDWAAEPLIAEIKTQARCIRPFDFCLRCAILNKDAFNPYYHTFLVPDEGYSHIIKLHDALYAGRLFAQRWLDMTSFPIWALAMPPMLCAAMP